MQDTITQRLGEIISNKFGDAIKDYDHIARYKYSPILGDKEKLTESIFEIALCRFAYKNS